MRETEGPGPELDLSADFMGPSDAEFADRLDRIAEESPGATIIIRAPLEHLSANVFRDRFSRFIRHTRQNQTRRFIIQNATDDEKALFKEKFPGAEWE